MKKAVLLIIIAALAVLSACAGGSARSTLTALKTSDYASTDFSATGAVVLAPEQASYTVTAEEITCTVTNNTPGNVTYDEQYALEIFLQDGWHPIPFPKNMIFAPVGYTLRPGVTNILSIKLSEHDFPFEPGHYRLVKQVDDYAVSAEFDLQ